MRKERLWQASVILALVVTIALNGLANVLPLNGQTTGDVANRFPTFFTPANYVFGIWSLIYLGLIAYAVFQAVPSQRANPKLRAIAPLFLLSCVANCVWLVLWHYNCISLTMVAMLVLLATLIGIYVQLARSMAHISAGERWFVYTPFSIYLGWITVATIANAAVTLYNMGWNGWGIDGAAWAALLVVVATVIGAAIVMLRTDWAYGGVLVWAFIGLYVKYIDAPLLAITSVVMAATVVFLIVLSLIRRRPPIRAVHQAT